MLTRSETTSLLKKLPKTFGIYQFKDEHGKIIYVGKANSLRLRVASYFHIKHKAHSKTAQLVQRIHSISTIEVASEIEALLLEAKLIKKNRPVFNTQWTDDKDYLYIKITWKDEIPRVLTARREKIPGNMYFGPFPSASTVKYTLQTLRRIFPYCNERKTQFRKDGTNLYTDLGLCPGPHAGFISLKDYRKHVRKLTQFLEGKKEHVVKQLEKEMKQAALLEQFERAGKIKKQLDGMAYITTQVTGPEEYLENPQLLLDKREDELQGLTKELGLPSTPVRIECYDISTIQGRFAVGSMVVFTNGQPDKSQYRRFRIRYKEIPKDVPNDFWMMREVLSRRLKNDWPLPDLFLIDGGKGQVSAVLAVLEENGIHIPVAGLAKRLEELFVPGKETSIQLPHEAPALHLVQRLRNEAHRFAITYHKKIRNKETLAA